MLGPGLRSETSGRHNDCEGERGGERDKKMGAKGQSRKTNRKRNMTAKSWVDLQRDRIPARDRADSERERRKGDIWIWLQADDVIYVCQVISPRAVRIAQACACQSVWGKTRPRLGRLQRGGLSDVQQESHQNTLALSECESLSLRLCLVVQPADCCSNS